LWNLGEPVRLHDLPVPLPPRVLLHSEGHAGPPDTLGQHHALLLGSA